MRKLFSMLVIFTMLLGMIGVPAVSATEATAPVFTMDISEYTMLDQIVKNGVTNSSANIKVVKQIRALSDMRSGPEIMVDTMNDGTKIEYLSFADADKTVQSDSNYPGFLGGIKLEDTLMSGLVGNGDEMTVEFWAKPYTIERVQGRAFTYGLNNNQNNVDMSWGVGSAATTISLYPVSYKTTADATGESGATQSGTYYNETNSAKDQWRYFALSRKWTTTNDTTGEGKWEWVIVIDGEMAKVNSQSVDVEVKEGVFKNNLATLKHLTIGGKSASAGLYDPFEGGIAEFKIYNKSLSLGELQTNYTAQSAKYNQIITSTEQKKGKEPVFTMDISEYSASRQVVKNGVDGSTDGISVTNKVRGDVTATGPELKKDYNADGTEIKYLSFADWGKPVNTDNNGSNNGGWEGFLGSVVLSDSLTTELVGDGGQMTIELWAKPYQNKKFYGRAFTYGTSAKDEMNIGMSTTGKQFTMNPILYANTTEVNPASPYAHMQTISNKHFYPDYEKWHHIAISRKWTETDATTGKGKWEYVAVMDGNASHSDTQENVYRPVLNSKIITIGGSCGGDITYNPFEGAVAEFKVYNEYMSETELKALYTDATGENGYAKYKKELKADGIYFTKENGAVIESFDVNTDTVTAQVQNKYGSCNTVMALYDNENNLKDVTMGNTLNLESYNLAEGWKIKCIVFGMSSLKPVFDTETITLGFAND